MLLSHIQGGKEWENLCNFGEETPKIKLLQALPLCLWVGLTLSQKWLVQLLSIWFDHFKKKKSNNNNSLFNGKIFSIGILRISVKYKTFFRENVVCWRCLCSQYLAQYLTFKNHSTHICSMIENFYHSRSQKVAWRCQVQAYLRKKRNWRGKKSCFSNICWTETWEL